MTIKKGQSWGQPGPLPAGAVVVDSDAAASSVVEAAWLHGRPCPPLGLLGGDLCRTLGGSGDEARLHSGRATIFTVDVGQVELDGQLRLFVAHLVARTRAWTRAFVAMNAQWCSGRHGNWNLGPRAHPNDGLIDTYDVHLRPGDLLRVRPRLHHGAHLPHPGIKERRSASAEVELGHELPVWLDGVAAGRAAALSVRVEPDALTVAV